MRFKLIGRLLNIYFYIFRAVEVGACGVPSFQVNDGPLIFGQDRLNIVEDMIYGWEFHGFEKLRGSKL